jgi:tRNA dimethylallyltransferase
MKTIAIIGPTASGKSDLAIKAAQATGARILSLDSLSIYKAIDIASAKPSLSERAGIPHYGIDVLSPDEPFNVTTFIALYREAERACASAEVPLIIVGGTSFYLKTLLEGISETPPVSEATRVNVAKKMQRPEEAYAELQKIDPDGMHKIKPNDRYRIEKMLTIYLQTGIAPSLWFEAHPPVPVLSSCDIFEIDVARDLLRERIALRTQKMVQTGLIDEVAMLEQRFGRAPQSMKAIGIVEVLDYLDGKIDKDTMTEQIITHTAQLAKRQQTFNRNQFDTKITMELEKLEEAVHITLSA